MNDIARADLKNGWPCAIEEIPRVDAGSLAERLEAASHHGHRICAFSVLGGKEIVVLTALDRESGLAAIRAEVDRELGYPSITARVPAAQAFERELFEEHGLRPHGHPWLKPVRGHLALDARARASSPAAPHPFFRVDGPGVHEVAVGPVHAGIIEPGHFRFQCVGETVLSLEIQLGYQHRGAKALILAASPDRRLAIAESIAGDTAIGHALAYCSLVESLANVEPPLPAQVLRAIALELERLANHVGDLGALANDVAFLPGASWLGRLRGELLNLLLELSGNRFGRGLLFPGGVRFAIADSMKKSMLARLARIERDLKETVEIMFDSPSVVSRFEHTGIVPREMADELGLVGVVARASGVERDVRRDHPTGAYRFAHIPAAHAETGDVMSRALVRWIEARRSLTFVGEQIDELRPGPLSVALPKRLPRAFAVALVEGWRGEIAHVATTDEEGEFASYQIVDPSFHNWFALAMALRGNQISDFPLANKSMNLSYAGHDL